jgi:hypothetical protein
MPKWSFLGIEAKRAGWFNKRTEEKMAEAAHRNLNIKTNPAAGCGGAKEVVGTKISSVF